MPNDFATAAEIAAVPEAKKQLISDEVIKAMLALGSEFVCAAEVALETDESGEYNLHYSLLPEFITVAQAAKALAISPTTVRRLLKNGVLTQRKIGKATTVGWPSVWAMLKSEPPRC